MLNFNCATWSLIPEHNFWQWAKLTSIFLVISVRLEQQSWFQVCVVPMVPITSCFIILLTWCDHGSITSLWNLSTNVSRSSSVFWAFPWYQLNSWWEMPSLPRWFVLSSTSLLRSLQQKLVCVLCYTSSSLLPSICSSLPWSITIFYVKKVVRITPPLKNSWYGDTSHPHHSFLVPVLFLTGIPTIELWGVNSKLLATLLLWSNGRVSF